MEMKISLTAAGGRSVSDVILDAVGVDDGRKRLESEPFPALGSLKRLGGSLIRKAANAVEGFGDGVSSGLLDLFRHSVARTLADVLRKKGVIADIQAKSIIKEGNTVSIDLSVTGIDYASAVNTILPAVLDDRDGEADGLIGGIIGIIGDERDKVVSAVLDAVSDEKKERIIGVIVGAYEGPICRKLTELLKKQNIELEVNSLRAETE